MTTKRKKKATRKASKAAPKRKVTITRASREHLEQELAKLRARAATAAAWEPFARAAIRRLVLAKFGDAVPTMKIGELAHAVDETDTVTRKVNAAINVTTNDAASFDDTKMAIRELRAMLQIAGPLSFAEDVDTAAVRTAALVVHATTPDGIAILQACSRAMESLLGGAGIIGRYSALVDTSTGPVCLILERQEGGNGSEAASEALDKGGLGVVVPVNDDEKRRAFAIANNMSIDDVVIVDGAPTYKPKPPPTCYACDAPCTDDNFCHGCKEHICDACDVAGASGDGLTGSHDVEEHLTES